MKLTTRITAFAAASVFASQPCMGAVAQGGNRLSPARMAPAAPSELQFDLASVRSPALATASMTMAASQQTASEAADQPKRKGIPTSALLIVGGVILAVVVLAAVAGAMPTAGPREGAFD